MLIKQMKSFLLARIDYRHKKEHYKYTIRERTTHSKSEKYYLAKKKKKTLFSTSLQNLLHILISTTLT